MIPLTRAAAVRVARRDVPQIAHEPPPWAASDRTALMAAAPSAVGTPASAAPTVSRMRSFACSITSAGTLSNVRDTANSPRRATQAFALDMQHRVLPASSSLGPIAIPS
jgi:hypothetical protein